MSFVTYYVLFCTFVFGSFIVATFTFFHQSSKRLGTIAIFVVSVATFASGVYSAYHSDTPMLLRLTGFVLCGIGAIGFTWTLESARGSRFHLVYAQEEPAELVVRGAYKLVRHPFYSFYLLFWEGMWVAAPSWPTFLCLLILVALYSQAAFGEERKFQNTPMAEEYLEYSNEVGSFVPKLRNLTPRLRKRTG